MPPITSGGRTLFTGSGVALVTPFGADGGVLGGLGVVDGGKVLQGVPRRVVPLIAQSLRATV